MTTYKKGAARRNQAEFGCRIGEVGIGFRHRQQCRDLLSSRHLECIRLPQIMSLLFPSYLLGGFYDSAALNLLSAHSLRGMKRPDLYIAELFPGQCRHCRTDNHGKLRIEVSVTGNDKSWSHSSAIQRSCRAGRLMSRQDPLPRATFGVYPRSIFRPVQNILTRQFFAPHHSFCRPTDTLVLTFLFS